MSYKRKFHTKWTDFDANKHMRHTAYNEYATEARIRFLKVNGFGMDIMEQNNIGPILFSEYTKFLKEIKIGEDIVVEIFLEGISERAERIKINHFIYREDGALAATISVSLAWIDSQKRKLTIPPKSILEIFSLLDKTSDFKEIILKR